MSEQENRQTGKSLLHLLCKNIQVADKVLKTVDITTQASGFAVSTVVVSTNGIALRHKVTGETSMAAAVFKEAVDDEYDSFNTAGGEPLLTIQPEAALPGKPTFRMLNVYQNLRTNLFRQ